MNKDVKKNPLDKHAFYTPCKKLIVEKLGIVKGCDIWAKAGDELANLLERYPGVEDKVGCEVIPAVAIYKVLEEAGYDAEQILCEFGTKMGEKFARIVHKITSIPGVDKLIWKNVDRIMHFMSKPDFGYERVIVSEPPEMFGVDILSCPYHKMAKILGYEKAVLCICKMDKAYMQGFHHIRYERHTAVSEGAECCDYRLRYDAAKE